MKKELSILIPTFNDECYDLVASLISQAELIEDLRYEILVSDDASTMTRVIISNRRISELPHCQFIENAVNRGRAAIRNALMRQAQFSWLLFIDAHRSIISDTYLLNYLQTTDEQLIVYGGHRMIGDHSGNLRFLYEKKAIPKNTPEKRSLHPNKNFNTSNIFISRELMEQHPLDERFVRYGYEDVFYGRQLAELGILVNHIDNPVGFCRFDDNADFVKKTEESLKTLCEFREELTGYSTLLDFTIAHPTLTQFVYRLYRKRRKSWRKKLCGEHPSLRIFKLYKLGYFASQLRKSLRKFDQENVIAKATATIPASQ